MTDTPLLIEVLRAPYRMGALSLAEWDLLLRQALAANLTASLHCLAEEHQVLAHVPPGPRRHLDWAASLLRRHGAGVRWEVARIRAALAGLDVPLILLKGAAYAVRGLAAARGRLFSDIDILVPRERIGEVEPALMLAGWMSHHHDAYDQRYYRIWMHVLYIRYAFTGPVQKWQCKGPDAPKPSLAPLFRARCDFATMMQKNVGLQLPVHRSHDPRDQDRRCCAAQTHHNAQHRLVRFEFLPDKQEQQRDQNIERGQHDAGKRKPAVGAEEGHQDQHDCGQEVSA